MIMRIQNCPICAERWAYNHSHIIGNYYILYHNNGNLYTVIYESRSYQPYTDVQDGQLTINGIIFLDEERIEKLLLLK